MEWYYIKDGAQAGPVSEETFRSLIQQGEIGAETLVWREGMSEWIPRAQCAAVVGVPPKLPTGPLCRECGKEFAADDLVSVGGVRVCGGCKPLLIQRLRQGVMPAGDGTGLFVDGNRMVVVAGATLPKRCVCCGNPAVVTLRRTYRWTPLWVYFLVLLGVLIAAIVSVFVTKQLKLELNLCEEHRVRRRNRLLIAWGWGLASLGATVLGFARGFATPDAGALVLVGILGFLSALAALAMGQQWAGILVAKRITKTGAILKGAGREFLSGLPVWTGGKDV